MFEHVRIPRSIRTSIRREHGNADERDSGREHAWIPTRTGSHTGGIRDVYKTNDAVILRIVVVAWGIRA